ncbi:hypothetical protein SDC9_172306 [bioreactor metagenome]|uniref:Uncharacterized protein n=1 Tax=bioreactor metagenome TaxID=1076179 RepID=A0A645GDB3_9ZZZZ
MPALEIGFQARGDIVGGGVVGQGWQQFFGFLQENRMRLVKVVVSRLFAGVEQDVADGLAFLQAVGVSQRRHVTNGDPFIDEGSEQDFATPGENERRDGEQQHAQRGDDAQQPETSPERKMVQHVSS